MTEALLGFVAIFAMALELGAAPFSTFLVGPIAEFWLIPYMGTDAGRATFGWLLGEGAPVIESNLVRRARPLAKGRPKRVDTSEDSATS